MLHLLLTILIQLFEEELHIYQTLMRMMTVISNRSNKIKKYHRQIHFKPNRIRNSTTRRKPVRKIITRSILDYTIKDMTGIYGDEFEIIFDQVSKVME